MAAAVRNHVTDDFISGQCKVANDVQDFVSDTLIREPQLIVDWPVVVEYQQIRRLDAFAQTLSNQPPRLGLQQECSAGSQFASKRFGRHRDAERLTADSCPRSVVEFELDR